MYESPINIIEIQDSFVSEIKEKTEEMVFTEIRRIGVDVDKEELLKALQYDREQYEKGYSDGYVKAIDEFAERLKSRGFVKFVIDQIAEEMKRRIKQ